MKISYFRDEFFFLSNFFPIKIEIDGKTYRSSEHYYQACKAMNEGEHDKIRNTVTAGLSKRAARRIKSFNPDWDNLRMDVMYKVLKAKFSIPEMKEALLATDGFELEEGNNWKDFYWGTVNGIGENHLGKMLMQVREELKNER